jgi:dihydroorotase
MTSVNHTGNNDIVDLVLLNGRVMDPESGLDNVRNLGISGGKVVIVTEEPIKGEEILDVGGFVVAPGFIDLHAHGQDNGSNKLQVHDGVTTAFDLEDGVFPVTQWYDSRKEKALINFGAAVGHIPIRIKVKHGVEVGHRMTNASWLEQRMSGGTEWATESLDPKETETMLNLIQKGLAEGALGIGIEPEYTTGASREEIFRIFQLAADWKAPVIVHVRYGGLNEPTTGSAGVQEVIANAAITGAPLHIVHITSMGGPQTPILLEMIQAAKDRGLDISTEAYPYTAWCTAIESEFLGPGWQEYLGMTYEDLQWVETGERLTEESFDQYRKQGGLVIGHGIPESAADLAIAHPSVMVASDGLPAITGGEHPRGAGTFARVLGRYVREKGALTLMEALKKMTLMPAQRFESFVPAMRKKGRLGAGMDADITIFDAERIIDRATFQDPARPSDGIVHVLVGGEFVLRDEKLVEGVLPGQPVQRDPERSR